MKNHVIEERISGLEATIWELRERIAKLELLTADPAYGISAAAQKAVFDYIAARIAENGGAVSVRQSDIAAATGAHQTHVGNILKSLIADGKITATGRREPLYDLVV